MNYKNNRIIIFSPIKFRHILSISSCSYDNSNVNKNISMKRTTKTCLLPVMSKICLNKYVEKRPSPSD